MLIMIIYLNVAWHFNMLMFFLFFLLFIIINVCYRPKEFADEPSINEVDVMQTYFKFLVATWAPKSRPHIMFGSTYGRAYFSRL